MVAYNCSDIMMMQSNIKLAKSQYTCVKVAQRLLWTLTVTVVQHKNWRHLVVATHFFFLSFACTKARLSSSVLTNACCMLTRTSTCNLRRLCSLGRSNLPHIGVAAARNNKVDHIAMTADFHRYLLLMVGYS